jgi:hypothetical protein
MRPRNTKACQQGAILTRQILQLQHFALHVNNKHKSRDHQISTTKDGNQGKLHTFGTTTEEESTHTASAPKKMFCVKFTKNHSLLFTQTLKITP